jgi:hypothetical protein
MRVITPLPPEPVPAPPPPREPREVMLADGRHLSLEGLDLAQLMGIADAQEARFARAILAYGPGSTERRLITGQAFETKAQLLLAQQDLTAHATEDAAAPLADQGPATGSDPIGVFATQLLQTQVDLGFGQPCLFELGFGDAERLDVAAGLGYRICGAEVSASRFERAAQRLGSRNAARLHLGDVRELEPSDLHTRPSTILCYDLLGRLPTDEVEDYLRHLHRLVIPGGWLVNIIPHDLSRMKSRQQQAAADETTAPGLRFAEYRLGTLTPLLKRTGWKRVATPLLATPRKWIVLGGGFRLAKQWSEPLLARMPTWLARTLSRSLAMSCTIATRRR